MRRFAGTLIENGLDSYGAVPTPMWVSMLDLKTRRIPEVKDPNWQRSYDAEDYMRNARGSNLYRDIPTIRAFYDLSKVTGDPRYRNVADAYLEAFFEHCVSPTTGLFAWGEHMFYNVVRDELEATRHELERGLPPWDEMWAINPGAVRREIEAIYNIHIWDKETFNYDRHGNFYTGRLDDLQVRGSYVKHSGLYAYSFLWLYRKTGERKYLEWALKVGEMFWKVRNPQTNLIAGSWAPTTSAGPSNGAMVLAYYLLSAYQLDPAQKIFLDMSAGFARAFAGPAYDAASGKLYSLLHTEDAKPHNASFQSPWGNGQGDTGIQGQTCVGLYKATRDAWFLGIARKYGALFLSGRVPPTASGETYGKNIDFLLDLYEVTKEPVWLHAVRRYANLAGDTMFENGLVKETADGYIYNANSGPGDLLHALLRLSRLEKTCGVPQVDEDRFPLFDSWKHPEWSKATDAVVVEVRLSRARNFHSVALDWTLDDGRSGRVAPSRQPQPGLYHFSIPAPGTGYAGRLKIEAEAIAREWRAWSEPRTIQVSTAASDESIQVAGVSLGYELFRSCPLPATQALKDSMSRFFRLRAASGELAFRYTEAEAAPYLANTLQISRWDGSAWRPLPTRVDSESRVLRADATGSDLYGVSGTPRLMWRRVTEGALQSSPAAADILGNGKLQILLDTGDIDRGLYLLDSAGNAIWKFSAKAGVHPPVVLREASASAQKIIITAGDTVYAIGRDGKAVWSKALTGSLSPPALTPDGRIIVGSTASKVTALSADGAVLWSEPASGPVVTVPAVAGSQIFVGCANRRFQALSDQGRPLWSIETRGPRFLPAAVGDINGDGRPEVVFGAKSPGTNYEVAALSMDGKKLWSVDAHSEQEWAPFLADMEGLGYKQVVIERPLAKWPLCELVILGEDAKPIRSIQIPSRLTLIPIVTDLDGDGKPDLILPTNEERRMYGIAHDGRILWSFQPVSYALRGAKMKGGGTPIVADIDGDGRLEVVTGDDETVLNCIRTETRVKPWKVVNGVLYGSPQHTGQ